MDRLINRNDQRELDRQFSERTGLPPIVLMEQAAAGLTGLIGSLLDSCGDYEGELDVLIMAGPGNNGGDGWAAARQLLAAGYRVLVYDVSGPGEPTGDAALNRQAYLALGGSAIGSLADLGEEEPLLVVDALYGTGFKEGREVPPAMADAFSVLALLKDRGSLILACDLPSGLDADTGQPARQTVAADFTASFGRKKIGLVTHPGLLYAGEVFDFPLGMTDSFADQVLSDQPKVLALDAETAGFPEAKPADGHKGQFGRVLLIGGAPGMAGALILAARAAEKMGVGYTMVRAPEESLGILAAAIPSALLSAVPEEGAETRRDLPDPDIFAIGPGAGGAPWVQKALRHLLRQPQPLIIDADGLNALAQMPDGHDLLRNRSKEGFQPAVLTPHPGEFIRLAPDLADLMQQNRLEATRRYADRTESILVLKGMATVIAFPNGDSWINTSGNVGLAKGGSGDVLTGMMAGLAAGPGSLADAVRLAVYLHGLAADQAACRLGSEILVTPTDLIDSLGQALLC